MSWKSSSRSRRIFTAPVLEALEERRLLAHYYVSPSGNDAWHGQSTQKPFRTLAKLNTINFQAGDQINLLGGATHFGQIYFDANDKGTAANPIKVVNWGAAKATVNAGTGFGIYAY